MAVSVFSIGGISGTSDARPPAGRVVEVVLEELVHLDVRHGVVALGRLLGLLGRLRVGGHHLLGGDLLQQERVLHDLLLQHLRQLEGGEREQLDGLLERGGEDEPLGETLRKTQLLLDRQTRYTPRALSSSWNDSPR